MLDAHSTMICSRQPMAMMLPLPTHSSNERFVSTERFFRCIFLFFRLNALRFVAIVAQVALTLTATFRVALAAYNAGRPDLILSTILVRAHKLGNVPSIVSLEEKRYNILWIRYYCLS
jgi:hypothetical protein